MPGQPHLAPLPSGTGPSRAAAQGPEIGSTSGATFTPCFDWVVRLTGDIYTALTYGVIWRYCQLRDQECWASQERLAAHLGWHRRTIARRIHRLLALGLIVTLSSEPGWSCHYGIAHNPHLPVTDSRMTPGPLPCDTQPAPSRTSGPIPPDSQSEGDPSGSHTKILSKIPNMIPSGDQGGREGVVAVDPALQRQQNPAAAVAAAPALPLQGSDDLHAPDPESGDAAAEPQISDSRAGRACPPATPGLSAVTNITGCRPPRALWQAIEELVGPAADSTHLQACYEAWLARGYNPRSYVWLFEWYADGAIPKDTRRPASSSSRNRHTYDDPTAGVDYAAWAEYQDRIEHGEDPEAVRQALGL
jgi:biotin operon repressor